MIPVNEKHKSQNSDELLALIGKHMWEAAKEDLSAEGRYSKKRARRIQKDLVPTVADNQTATTFHGIGSLFGEDCALERDVIANHVEPRGILNVIPAIPTANQEIKQGTITGFNLDGGAAEPNFPCEDAPKGTYSACKQSWTLGRVHRETQTMDMTQVFARANRADTDFTLRGAFLSSRGFGNLEPRQLTNMSPSEILNVIVQSEMLGVGMLFQNEVNRMVWQGDKTAGLPWNTAGGGKKSFDGIDILINTGITDVDSGLPCPAMNSKVFDFNYQDVCDTTGSYTIVGILGALEHYVRSLADHSNISPITGIIAVHPNLWQILTACYPCQYHTDRCRTGAAEITGDGTIVRFNDNFGTQERERYRSGMFLPINGVNYAVVPDWGIDEHHSGNDVNLTPGEYSSDITYLPLSILGGWPVTFMPYHDHSLAGRDIESLRNLGVTGPSNIFWTDDGRFAWAMEWVKFCLDINGVIQPGLVIRTPQLGFRIENVKYTPEVPLRNPFSDHPDYVT